MRQRTHQHLIGGQTVNRSPSKDWTENHVGVLEESPIMQGGTKTTVMFISHVFVAINGNVKLEKLKQKDSFAMCPCNSPNHLNMSLGRNRKQHLKTSIPIETVLNISHAFHGCVLKTGTPPRLSDLLEVYPDRGDRGSSPSQNTHPLA